MPIASMHFELINREASLKWMVNNNFIFRRLASAVQSNSIFGTLANQFRNSDSLFFDSRAVGVATMTRKVSSFA